MKSSENSRKKVLSSIDPRYAEGMTFQKKRRSKYTIGIEDLTTAVARVCQNEIVIHSWVKGEALSHKEFAKMLHTKIVEAEEEW
jgi:hypothetical protein